MIKSDAAKLLLSVVLDVLDFTIGRIPGFELAFDAFLAAAAVAMWGWPGLFALWEIVDPTGQADAFVPTMTLVAVSQLGKAKKKAATTELRR